ncbi:MAG: hypothetical protein JNK12_12620 [Acidimicrobiales bacterium]|nr:hypothetical protein [Acidimicrobiales bacterium]
MADDPDLELGPGVARALRDWREARELRRDARNWLAHGERSDDPLVAAEVIAAAEQARSTAQLSSSRGMRLALVVVITQCGRLLVDGWLGDAQTPAFVFLGACGLVGIAAAVFGPGLTRRRVERQAGVLLEAERVLVEHGVGRDLLPAPEDAAAVAKDST